jgi:membrane protease YdiL (CAAX protease family)
MSIAPPGQPLPPPDLPELPAGVVSAGAMPRATWTPLVAWLGGFAIFLAASILAVVPVAFGGDLQDPAPLTTFASLLVQDTGVLIAVWFVVQASGSATPLASLGMRPTPILKAIGWLAAVYAGYFVFAAIWSAVVNAPKEDLLHEIGADQSLIASIAIAFSVCVLAPLAEETLFRGFIFGGLRRWQGFWPAALISGSMFGLAHAGGADVSFLLPLAVFGFGLALLYELTKSIFPGIYLHSINNSIAFSVGLNLGWETGVVFVGSLSAITLALLATRRMA